jgi:glycosyltransferase involved in cell wall biosynthesis
VRVALLSPCFWPEVRRGTERFVRELADGLILRGHHPELITSHDHLPSRRIEDGLPVLRLPRPPQRRLLRRGYEPYLTHVPLSYIALRAGRYDVAHAVYPADALAAARWRTRTGGPAVLSYMGIPDRTGLREFRKRLDILLRAIDGCDAVVALSRYAAEAFRYWLGYDPRVIPPGVDMTAFQPLAERHPVPTIVCSADALEPRKHVGLLIESLGLVRQELPGVRLVLSRPGDLGRVRRAGLDVDAPGVEWRALDDRSALARAYGEAWVTALPSSSEAFGLVLAESLACGTPVVGYRDGAIPELVDRPELGRVFDRLEPYVVAQSLLEAIELARRPETRQECRKHAEGYSSELCSERYAELYRELVAS